jgi:hypothetical protein
MVIRREAMASKEIGTAAAAGGNLRPEHLVFVKHEPRPVVAGTYWRKTISARTRLPDTILA